MASLPKISISATGQDGVQAVLGIAAEGIDFKRIGRDTITPFVEDWVKKQFESEGRHGDGPGWHDYSNEPVYRAFKRRVAGHLKLLRWTQGDERLYPSLTDKSHPEHIREATDDSFTYGTQVPYATRLSELGGVGPFDEPYPARPIFRISDSQRTELFRDIQRDIQKSSDQRWRLQV